MFASIDFQKLWALFIYDPKDPLLFSTSFFLFFFLALLIFYRFAAKNLNSKVILLLVFSFFFYYKVSGLFLLLLLASTLFNFFAGKWMAGSPSAAIRKFLLLLAIIVNIGLLIYFKYTNFFIQILNDLKFTQLNALEIILPIGISFYTFKALSYVFDIYLERIEPEMNIANFCLYISFFPSILAGPIDRATDFLPQLKEEFKLTDKYIGTGIFLICSGLLKKAVIADFISLNFVDRVFDMPTRFTGVENLLAVYAYGLQIFCDFSGYSDMAIGIALLLGYRLMNNFDSPYKAASIAEFWRRWHISLSSWLQDYLFKPMQMQFRNLSIFGNALALLVTFTICGLWHGSSWTFIFWGALHGFYMAFSLFTKKWRNKLYDRLGIRKSKALKVFQIFITFHLLVFSWIFFRANSFATAMDVLSQIFNFFHVEVFPQYIRAFPVVFILIVGGYLLHFMPHSVKLKTEELVTRTPLFGKAVLMAIMIWVVIQFRSADIQPFIYFQF